MAMGVSYRKIKEEMGDLFHSVATEIGRDWKKLGRELKISSTVESIDDDFKYTDEKAYQVLNRWYQKNGNSGATKEVLCEALRKIGKISMAEELECCNLSNQNGHCNVPTQKTQPSPAESRMSPVNTSLTTSSFPTTKALDNIDNELDEMLKCSQRIIPFCQTDCAALVYNQKIVQHLQAINEILMETTCSQQISGDDEQEIAEKKKARKTRYQQTDQTICLIEKLLKDKCEPCSTVQKIKRNKTRPVSEILQRCTSEIILQPRSDTFSGISLSGNNSRVNRSGSRGSSPLPPSIYEVEKEHADLTDEPPQTARCESCGSCLNFNVKTDSAGIAAEKQEIPKDEKTNQKFKSLHITDEFSVAEGDKMRDSKL